MAQSKQYQTTVPTDAVQQDEAQWTELRSLFTATGIPWDVADRSMAQVDFEFTDAPDSERKELPEETTAILLGAGIPAVHAHAIADELQRSGRSLTVVAP